MILFFPWQAARLGDRVMNDTAVTIASVFAASIEPAYGSARRGRRADHRDGAAQPLERDGGARARGGDAPTRETWARIAVRARDRVRRLRRAPRRHTTTRDQLEAATRSAPLSVESIAGGNGLRVTAPVYASGSYRGFFRIDFSTQTFAALARSNLWTCIARVALRLRADRADRLPRRGVRSRAPMIRVRGGDARRSRPATAISPSASTSSPTTRSARWRRTSTASCRSCRPLMREVAENAATLVDRVGRARADLRPAGREQPDRERGRYRRGRAHARGLGQRRGRRERGGRGDPQRRRASRARPSR